MAKCAGIHHVLWRPEELGITIASEVIPILKDGIIKLESDPNYYKQFNASNGWGTYDDFLSFCKNVLRACEENPNALIKVSR